jgi:hypothetical protein
MFDLRWKAACELAVTAEALPTTLTYWRRRPAGGSRPQRIFDVVAQVVTATAVLRGRRPRAPGSKDGGDHHLRPRDRPPSTCDAS